MNEVEDETNRALGAEARMLCVAAAKARASRGQRWQASQRKSPSKRRRLVGGLVAAVAVAFMAHLLIVFSPLANAQEEPLELSDEAADAILKNAESIPIDEEPPPRDFFKLYPAGEGADSQSYEELDKSEQGYLDRAGEWAETGNGHAVHSRWSGVARQKRKEANAKRAQQLSGTQGLSELGVD